MNFFIFVLIRNTNNLKNYLILIVFVLITLTSFAQESGRSTSCVSVMDNGE